MVLKNCLVWNGTNFEKSNLYVKGSKIATEYDHVDGPVVDATGLFVMPGFVDSHAHIIGTGMLEIFHNLNYENLESILISVKDEKYVLARGWEELPKNELLTLANKLTIPVILIRKCGHTAWVNERVRKELELQDNLIFESDLEKIWSYFGDELYVEAFHKGVEKFLSLGVTQVHSDDFHGVSFETLKKLLMESKLRILEKLYTSEPWNYKFGEFGIGKIGAIKIFADGSLGARTAYMIEPYSDTGKNGVFTLPENFDEIVQFAEKTGLQLCVHVIGDLALHEVLNRFERLKVNGKHRLIHVQFVRNQDFYRLRSYHLSVQPHFYFEDLELLRYVRYELSYPFHRMFQEGFSVAFSTDAPVSPADPRYVIENAMRLGFNLPDAVKLYTEAGSQMAGFKAGKLEANYLADFCVYDADPFRSKPLAVFVNGEIVYGSL
uniref:Amidohydrolase n=1 Tax=Fervidobacterium thailandense TaxID=1008305 RepID=A0A7C5RJK3_9BACT